MRFCLRTTLFVLVLTSFYTNATDTIPNPSKRKGAGPLFRISRNDKWGYMDRNGRTQITPRFDAARDFMAGYAAVLVNEKWGYIDERGNVTIRPQFDDVGDFTEDLAAVRVGRKWGYIDRSGRIVIEPQFQAAAEFHEGLARVYSWNRAICIDGQRYTREDAPEFFYRIPSFDQIISCLPEDGHFGLIDKKGTIVVPLRFYWLEDMSGGLAVARVDGIGGKYGYIDRTGAFVVKPIFNQADSFAEGLAGVEVSSRIVDNKVIDIRRGYIDRSGRVVIPAIYEFVGSFSEGLARVGVSGFRMGYVNREGKMIIAPRFTEAWDFSNGMAAACDAGGCSYIDHTGVAAIKDKRAWWPFSDGLAVVPPAGPGQVYIDLKGRTVARYN